MGLHTHFSALKLGQHSNNSLGFVAASQTGVITQNSTTAVSLTFTLPVNAQILDFLIDETVAYDSATSATLTIGTAAAGTQYVTSVNAKTGGRVAATHTAAQVAAMANIGTTNSVVATITPVGATTAGTCRITVRYVVNEN